MPPIPESHAARSLIEWPSSDAAPVDELRWRRVVRGLGIMPIEVFAPTGVVGRLVALNHFGTRYRVETSRASGEFVTDGLRRRARGSWEAAGVRAPLFEARRTAFRRRRVVLGSGEILEWRKRGLSGKRFSLSRPRPDAELLSLVNTGGALRWRGTVRLRREALDLGPLTGPAVLVSVFLAFNS